MLNIVLPCLMLPHGPIHILQTHYVSVGRNTGPKNKILLDAGSLPRTGEQYIVQLVTTKAIPPLPQDKFNVCLAGGGVARLPGTGQANTTAPPNRNDQLYENHNPLPNFL